MSKNEIKTEDFGEEIFENVSSEVVDYIDESKPIKPLEYNTVLLWIAISFTVILVIYSVPIGIFVVPQFFDGGIVAVMIIGCVMTMLMPAVLIVVITCMLKNYFKSKKYFKQVISNNPYFTRGKIIFQERPLKNGTRKIILYCYIDKWEEKHVNELKGSVAAAMARPGPVMVAYTADGKSAILGSYSITEDALEGLDYEDDEEEQEE